MVRHWALLIGRVGCSSMFVMVMIANVTIVRVVGWCVVLGSCVAVCGYVLVWPGFILMVLATG